MRKHIKYSASFIIIILSLVLGFTAYAEEDSVNDSEKNVACTMDAKVCPDGSSVGRVGPKCEFAKCPDELNDIKNRNLIRDKGEIKNIRAENQIRREESKKEVEDIREEIKNKREENKAQLETMVESIKEKREVLKTELEAKREEAKTRLEEMKAKFKEDLKKVSDENKKIAAEKIVETITSLNERHTTTLSEKVNQIENVLVSIESRISKAETNGLDVASVKLKVKESETAIATARTAIATQASKVYEINVTDEATLRVEMQKLRDSFKTDIKAVNELVKKAHIAVRNTAITLAQIPRVNEAIGEDDDVENTEVEDNTTTNNQ